MSSVQTLPPQSFQEDVKEFFRLYAKKKELMEQMKAINAEFNAVKRQVEESMVEQGIPGIEYGTYRLKCSKSKRKQPISEKLLKGCTYFMDNEEARAQFLASLSGDRQVVERTLLQVRNKI